METLNTHTRKGSGRLYQGSERFMKRTLVRIKLSPEVAIRWEDNFSEMSLSWYQQIKMMLIIANGHLYGFNLAQRLPSGEKITSLRCPSHGISRLRWCWSLLLIPGPKVMKHKNINSMDVKSSLATTKRCVSARPINPRHEGQQLWNQFWLQDFSNWKCCLFPQIILEDFMKIKGFVVQGVCSDANVLLIQGYFEHIIETFVNASRRWWPSSTISTSHCRKANTFNWLNVKSDINWELFWTIRDYVILVRSGRMMNVL